MSFKKITTILMCFFVLHSCVSYKDNKIQKKNLRKFYSSSGFALIYEDKLYDSGVVSKKINNDTIVVMHNILKPNTSIKIINPLNSKIIKTKINKKSEYPKIFNVLISSKVASILELDNENPFIELIEVKKNKTFVAKKANTFEEEKNVAEKAPVDEIKMDDLTNNQNDTFKKTEKNNIFFIVINDFYYKDSAINLKKELNKKKKFSNLFVKKITTSKYRLLMGPFKNFNALKTSYISLNNLGFDDINVYKE